MYNATTPINTVFTGISKSINFANSVIVYIKQLFPVPGDPVMSKIGAVYIIPFALPLLTFMKCSCIICSTQSLSCDKCLEVRNL